jgi:ABC-type amino acid transport substrate-binding protein
LRAAPVAGTIPQGTDPTNGRGIAVPTESIAAEEGGMFRHRSSLIGCLARGAVLASLALALAACGEEPSPPRLIGFSPAVLTVPANEALAISVEYEENDFSLQDFQWSAEAGQIEGNGSPSITYRAPEHAGDYAITVTVAYGEEQAPLSLDSVIKVTAAVAAEVPAEVPEPETSAAERAPSAEETARPVEEAVEGAATEAEGAVEQAATPSKQAAEEAAAPVEEIEGAVTEAEEAGKRAATANEQAAEEAPSPVEGATERAVPDTQEAVEEAAAATEQATEEPAATVEGAGRAAESVEEAATATIAAIREEAEREPAASSPAARAEGEVAAVAERAKADVPRAVEPAAGPQAGDQPRAGAAPGPETAPEAEVAALTEAAEARSGGSRIDHILERHRLTAIVQIAFEPFSFYGEEGRRTGFEIDLMREFARRWLDDPKAVTFLPVPTDARIPTLEKGRADIIAAALTKTPERAEKVDFSLTYFKDGQRLLVPEGSAMADVCDLRGKKVAAIDGSTSLDNIEAAARSCGFELGEDLVTFRRHDDAVEALLAGEVEAFTSDGVALANFAEGRPLKVVGNHFSEEPYGIAVPKGDERLLELVNHTLKEMERDGTYAALYEKWFGDDSRPYPLEQTAPATTEVAALATTSAPAILEPKAGPDEPVEAYVVQAGDTLSRIAGKVYGDVSPRSWRRIYEANREAIGDDPSRIQVGMTLTIPQ